MHFQQCVTLVDGVDSQGMSSMNAVEGADSQEVMATVDVTAHDEQVPNVDIALADTALADTERAKTYEQVSNMDIAQIQVDTERAQTYMSKFQM